MARARNIKPGFFKNYDLADAGSYAQLLFAGLWCLADREGRVEDKPRLIKAEIFPYYDYDVNGGLTVLERLKFVNRYSAEGVDVIQIVNFKKHQTPHNTERASVLPPPLSKASATPVVPTVSKDNGGFTVGSRNNNDGKTPDSLIHRFTDSPIPELKAYVPDAVGDLFPRAPHNDCPHQKIIELYHEILPQCPRVKDWTPARATQLRARWNEDQRRQNLDWWRGFFDFIAGCDFLVGKSGKNPFFADLEWITKSSNFTKIREDKYANRVAA